MKRRYITYYLKTFIHILKFIVEKCMTFSSKINAMLLNFVDITKIRYNFTQLVLPNESK